MKKSLRCEQCRRYFDIASGMIEDAPWEMLLHAECPYCGRSIERKICPTCVGTGWDGFERCPCDAGLVG